MFCRGRKCFKVLPKCFAEVEKCFKVLPKCFAEVKNVLKTPQKKCFADPKKVSGGTPRNLVISEEEGGGRDNSEAPDESFEMQRT